MSAALTAPLVGAWADQQYEHDPDTYLHTRLTDFHLYSGRRRLCMAFCVTYTITCLCITVPSLPILFFGRVLGGLSTSILYSAFESWLVSSSNNLALPQSALSNILGRATLINGIVAAIAGVVSNKLVSTTLTFKSPFIASGALLVLAWVVINRTWHENRGGASNGDDGGILQLRRLGQAWHIVKSGEQSSPTVLITLTPCRSSLACFGAYPNLLRRVYVSLCFCLGPHVARGCTYGYSPVGNHILSLHAVYDDRLTNLHRHCFQPPTDAARATRRLIHNSACQTQFPRMCYQCTCSRCECEFA